MCVQGARMLSLSISKQACSHWLPPQGLGPALCLSPTAAFAPGPNAAVLHPPQNVHSALRKAPDPSPSFVSTQWPLSAAPVPGRHLPEVLARLLSTPEGSSQRSPVGSISCVHTPRLGTLPKCPRGAIQAFPSRLPGGLLAEPRGSPPEGRDHVLLIFISLVWSTVPRAVCKPLLNEQFRLGIVSG